MPYILRIFGTGTPHILGYFAGGVPKIGGVEYPMTPALFLRSELAMFP